MECAICFTPFPKFFAAGMFHLEAYTDRPLATTGHVIHNDMLESKRSSDLTYAGEVYCVLISRVKPVVLYFSRCLAFRVRLGFDLAWCCSNLSDFIFLFVFSQQRTS